MNIVKKGDAKLLREKTEKNKVSRSNLIRLKTHKCKVCGCEFKLGKNDRIRKKTSETKRIACSAPLEYWWVDTYYVKCPEKDCSAKVVLEKYSYHW